MDKVQKVSQLHDMVGAPSTITDARLIRAFQMKCAKRAIKLEKLGLRHSRLRGGAKRLWAKHFNLPANASHDDVIAKLDESITSLEKEYQNEHQQQSLI
jgi:hypothetical protein